MPFFFLLVGGPEAGREYAGGRLIEEEDDEGDYIPSEQALR